MYEISPYWYTGPTCQILISIYEDILSKKNHEHCLYQPIHHTESSYNKELANSINNKERYDAQNFCLGWRDLLHVRFTVVKQ